MQILIAILLGIVEGLTEFLPISSTGHLILIGDIVGFTGDKASTFQIFIQLGAILAVVWLYRQRFASLLELRNNNSSGLRGRRGLMMLGLTTLPALLAGFLLHDFIKGNLFQPRTVAIGLAVGGVIMIVFERFKHKAGTISLDSISPRQALGVGLFQLFALWPGVSRSASTIIGGVVQGLDRKTAVEYSFLIAVPVMIAATGYDLLKSLDILRASDIPLFASGFLAAFAAATFAVKYFVEFVKRFGFTAFGWYRLALAALVFVFIV